MPHAARLSRAWHNHGKPQTITQTITSWLLAYPRVIVPARFSATICCLASGFTATDCVTMASTHKRVIVRKFSRDTLSGYVAPSAFIANGKLELLNTGGNLVFVELSEVKSIFFVRDFSDAEFTRKTFTSRPRTEGLWVRMKFKDNDLLEGLMSNDLTQVSADGFLLNPPDTRGNVQRIFVPRSAVVSVNVLAVIGSPQARRKAAQDQAAQPELFSE